MQHNIRQLEEKNIANEVTVLLWSARMDLVAFANSKGEVALHRLTWTRAWSLGPSKEGDTVSGLAWRPDGKVLAIAYGSGEVLLVNVENKVSLNSFQIEGKISCIYWEQEVPEVNKSNKIISSPEETNDYMKYLDCSSVFLLPPSSYFNTKANAETMAFDFFRNQTELNVLIVGTEEGYLHLSIFGCFPPIVLNLNQSLGYACQVTDVHVSEMLNKIFVTVRDEFGTVRVVVFKSEIFKSHKKELFAMAMKHENLTSLLNNMISRIADLKENWESILLEMDAKLSTFASMVPEGTLSADFLDLLMFGISSDEMIKFLLHDLTKKGLEKFGQTIEMSYGNIQKLLLKNVNKGGQSIIYHLAELRGMARLEHRYKVLGLQESEITTTLGASGAFLTKGGEMQQIINHSIISYKAFFRWLYTAIMHLLEEPISAEMPKMTQQDVACIAEFLLNFDEIGSKNNTSVGGHQQTGFIMERLGQYLADSPLKIPVKMENEWDKFLSENECLREHESIIKRYQENSLVQQFNVLKEAVNNIFVQPTKLIAKTMQLCDSVNCLNMSEPDIKFAYVNTSSDSCLVAYLSKKAPADSVNLIEFSWEGGEIARSHDVGGQSGDFGARSEDFGGRSGDFGGRSGDFGARSGDFGTRPQSSDFGARSGDFAARPTDSGVRSGEIAARSRLVYFTQSFEGVNGNNFYEINDIKFYSNRMLSLLLQENSIARTGKLCQFPLCLVMDKLNPINIEEDLQQQITAIDGSTLGSVIFKSLDGMVASKFSVSGIRKVSIVLSENKRKVRLYEMEAEEDDEDNDLTISTVRESDTSI